eukprot:10036583-Ditylum_brightwellii.AAC.1
MSAYGHRVGSYHAYNSRFDSKEFQHSCQLACQTYSYCSVGAHHQNGIAEAMNKRHIHNCRTSLLHTKRKWPSVIKPILWPFCYKVVEDRHNRLNLNSNRMSPQEVLLGFKQEIMVEDFHTWGCPVFALDSTLQSAQ